MFQNVFLQCQHWHWHWHWHWHQLQNIKIVQLVAMFTVRQVSYSQCKQSIASFRGQASLAKLTSCRCRADTLTAPTCCPTKTSTEDPSLSLYKNRHEGQTLELQLQIKLKSKKMRLKRDASVQFCRKDKIYEDGRPTLNSLQKASEAAGQKRALTFSIMTLSSIMTGVGKTTYIVSAHFRFYSAFFYCQPILT